MIGRRTGGAQALGLLISVLSATRLATPDFGPVCPECAAGKHLNCDGVAWDFDLDRPTTCACATALHVGGTP